LYSCGISCYFSLRYNFIWILSLFVLMNLTKGLSMLFIISKNWFMFHWFFFYFFKSLSFISALILIFFLLFTLGFVLFPVPLGVRLDCLFELFCVSWGRPLLLYFPFRTAFAVSQWFWTIVSFHSHLSTCVLLFFYFFFNCFTSPLIFKETAIFLKDGCCIENRSELVNGGSSYCPIAHLFFDIPAI